MLSAGQSARRLPLLLPFLLPIITMLGVALTARLGVWQLDRARQKLDLQQQIAGRADMPMLAQADLARQDDAAPAQHYRRIRLKGRWLAEHTVYLDNRQMNGRPGFFVLTPLLLVDVNRLDGTPTGGDAVLVQRGWVPRDFVDRTRLAPLVTPVGEVTVAGRIAPPPSKLFALGGADTGPIRQNLDLAVWARDIGVNLRPLSVQQTAGETLLPVGDADAPVTASMLASAPASKVPASAATAKLPVSAAVPDLLRQWPAPAVDVAKHHGYAFQWFALSALIAGLFVWFQLVRPRWMRNTPAHGRPSP